MAKESDGELAFEARARLTVNTAALRGALLYAAVEMLDGQKALRVRLGSEQDFLDRFDESLRIWNWFLDQDFISSKSLNVLGEFLYFTQAVARKMDVEQFLDVPEWLAEALGERVK